MRYVFLIVTFLTLGSLTADQFDETMDRAKEAGRRTADDVLAQGAEPYKISIKIEDDEKRFYRKGQLILSRSPVIETVYRLNIGDRIVGRVILNRPESPRIFLDPNLDVAVFVEATPDNPEALLLQFFNARSGYLEAYILTADSVRPLDANAYLALFAEAEASRAGFGVVGESLSPDAQSDEP